MLRNRRSELQRMYAHQVIDSLKTKYSNIQLEAGEHSERIAHSIMNSQKFHVDGMEILDLAKKNFGNELTCKGLKLPYKLCWFDWNYNGSVARDGCFPSSKRGLLVEDVIDTYGSGELILRLCGFHDVEKKWFISRLRYITEPGYGRFQAVPLRLDFYTWFEGLSNQELNEENQADLTVFVNTLKLLNSRNIGTEITCAPDKLNVKRRKKGKIELFSYHTLVIKPVGKKQETIPKHLWDNRIHLCRGHFKEYTEERKLFGKYTGRYWWQPLVRGRNKDGVVLKDYVIKH